MAESDVWLASEVVVLSQYLVDVENEGSPPLCTVLLGVCGDVFVVFDFRRNLGDVHD